jgi:hypothetical protein
MSLCTRNRWGTGVSSSSNTRSDTDKEMEDKLKKMKDERSKQDTMWIQEPIATINSSKPNNSIEKDI